MSDWFEKIINKIQALNSKIDNYNTDTVIQSLPSVAYVNRAKKLIEKGQYKDALEILTEAESLPQEDALVYKYKGIIYDRLFRFDDAVQAYKKSANLNKNDKLIWKNLGYSLLNTGLYDEADEAFENADKITPTNSEVFLGWGMSLMKQQKYPEAHEKFVLSSKYNRYNSNALFLAAVMEIKLKMYDDAESKLQFLANVAPNEGNSYEYAKLKFILKDYDGAIFYAQKSLDFNRNMLPCYLLLGEIYRLKNEENLSLENYKKAEELSLITVNLYIEWAFSLIKFDKYAEASEKIMKAEEIDCANSEVKLIKAFLSVIKGDIFENREIIEKILKENSEAPLAHRALGILNCLDGNYKEGIHYFKSALKLEPTEVINYYYIAKAYMHLADNSNAKEYFEMSIKENPSHIKTYIDYSKFLISIDDYANANRKLRKALRQAEDNIEILNMLFYVNYILVKDRLCEYNIKETLDFAQKIKSIDAESFKYPDKLAELAEMLNKLQEKE